MSHQLITQEELALTIEYLNYNGPIASDLPLEFDTERKQGLSKVVASSAF
ncbi:MAG: hypothetical protein JSW11_05415 [Candidatus Heimdallarchaeota archaeon]|nr:MAG: hypothetical protein JSW11_05415 [Candidatus Heimdallarchaeota archaeon]